MKYYLRKEPFEHTIKEIVKTNGEVIPERKVIADDRALYQATDLYSRRYRDLYPIPQNKGVKVYTCETLSHIMKERESLFNYCDEWFDVYNDNGKVDTQ